MDMPHVYTCVSIKKTCVKLSLFRYKVEISGGLGAQAGKIWRVGIMGYNATPENVQKVLRALDEGLKSVRGNPRSQL